MIAPGASSVEWHSLRRLSLTENSPSEDRPVQLCQLIRDEDEGMTDSGIRELIFRAKEYSPGSSSHD